MTKNAVSRPDSSGAEIKADYAKSNPRQAAHTQQVFRETAPSKQNRPSRSQKLSDNTSHIEKKAVDSRRHTDNNSRAEQQYKKTNHQKYGFSVKKLIHGFLPSSFYNHDTKKLFGLITAEDLLLIALILLFSENENDDDSLLALALVYILLSDYIDLPDFLI